jgi:protein-disulfide isomerase
MENKISDKYFLPAALLIGLALIAGAIYWNGQHPSPPGTPGAPTITGGTAPTPAPAVAVNVKDVKTSGAPFIGNANAPVVIAEWSDFQCPFCKQFETNALQQIIKDYVNSGKVKVIFKEFAFLGNDSTTAGEYELAIWKLYPEKYLAWRTAMYDAQDQEGDQGFGNAASIDKLNATIAGIDAAKVAADVKANAAAYQAQLDADKAEAAKFGIGATPSFVIGTQMIAGAYPYDTFKTAIDKVLGK